MNGVSVIVCCYNSATRLSETLEHLAKQKVLSTIPWEVVIVDNASNDNTREVAETIWKNFNTNVPFRVVSQPTPGLSFARDKGIEKSTFDTLIFCDDDNLLCENYIESAFLKMQSDPEIGAIGGYGQSVYPLPAWLEDFSEFYALGPQGEESGYVSNSRGCLYGAGLVLRKSALHLLKEQKFKSITTDRKGNSLISGGDTELTFAIRILGYKLYYDENLRFRHLINSSRFNAKYFNKLIFSIGYSWASLQPYHIYFNKLRDRFPIPNSVDIFYSLKSVLLAFLSLVFQIAKLNRKQIRRAFVTLTFKCGELWFMFSKFRSYDSTPEFLKRQK